MGRRTFLVECLFWLAYLIAVRALMAWWFDAIYLAAVPLVVLFESLTLRLFGRPSFLRRPLRSAIRSVSRRIRRWSRRTLAEELGTDRPAGFCPGCGYPMNPGQCPECGRVSSRGALRRTAGRSHRLPVRAAATAGICAVLLLALLLAYFYAPWTNYCDVETLLRLSRYGESRAQAALVSRYRVRSLTPAEASEFFKSQISATATYRRQQPAGIPVGCEIELRLRTTEFDRGRYIYLRDHRVLLNGAPIREWDQSAEHQFRRGKRSRQTLIELPPLPPGEHRVTIECMADIGIYNFDKFGRAAFLRDDIVPVSAELEIEALSRPAESFVVRVDDAAMGAKDHGVGFRPGWHSVPAPQPNVTMNWPAVEIQNKLPGGTWLAGVLEVRIGSWPEYHVAGPCVVAPDATVTVPLNETIISRARGVWPLSSSKPIHVRLVPSPGVALQKSAVNRMRLFGVNVEAEGLDFFSERPDPETEWTWWPKAEPAQTATTPRSGP